MPKDFRHYIEKGCEIDFCVAIDFTSSNGNPNNTDSCHYQGGDTLNDYEETITTGGKALSVYNNSEEYSVWGFGTKFGREVKPIFQCG